MAAQNGEQTIINGHGEPRRESSLDRDIENEVNEIARLWSPYLYSLQQRAPKARVLPLESELVDSDSSVLGIQYHGLISKAEAVEKLLCTSEGTYLIRKKASGQYMVSFKFSYEVKHLAIKLHNSKFLYDDKEFDSMNDLVDDTLILLYLDQHNIKQHLSLGRVQQQNINAKLKRRNGLRYKTEENKKTLFRIRSRESITENNSDSIDGVFRRLSYNVNIEEEPIKVYIENEDGVKQPKTRATSEKVKHKKFHLHKKRDMSLEDRKSCPPSEIVNLLGIYTIKSYNGDEGYELNKQTSTSTGDISSTGAIGQLLKKTLTIHSDDDDETANDQQSSNISLSRSSSTSSSYLKSHNFKFITYKGPTWCDLCHHYLWGLVQQGMKCQDCGINIHKQCSEGAHEMDCIPTKKLVKRVFGVDLTTVVIVDDSSVPKFLKQSIMELELRGLMTEGIYRVPGRTLHIMELKDSVDENEDIDLSQVSDVHVIAAVIKLFLRELPIPLITFDAYPHLLNCIKDKDIQCDTIRQILIDHLPRAHYDSLKHIIHHLTKVVEFSHLNKMQSSNLAVVFAPTIMRSPNTENLSLADIPIQKRVVEFLINNYMSVLDP